METTEKIVEAYVRYVKGWATIPNIRCAGQNEIDLIAIDPQSVERYHIEVSVSISQGFRKLTGAPYDIEKAKQRVHQASQRRTIGFFAEKKFAAPGVIERLRDYGFEPGGYRKVVVSWGWTPEAEEAANVSEIVLWDFRAMIGEIAEAIGGSREYFVDDTLRTLNLFLHAGRIATPNIALEDSEDALPKDSGETEPEVEPLGDGAAHYWVYENWVHNYATVHRAACSYCNNGRGLHSSSSQENSRWHGPFSTVAAALAEAKRTGRDEIRRCGACAPADD